MEQNGEGSDFIDSSYTYKRDLIELSVLLKVGIKLLVVCLEHFLGSKHKHNICAKD